MNKITMQILRLVFRVNLCQILPYVMIYRYYIMTINLIFCMKIVSTCIKLFLIKYNVIMMLINAAGSFNIKILHCR